MMFRVTGRYLSEEELNKSGMEVPVVIKSAEHSRKYLGLKLPPPDTTLSDIADTLGRDFPVKVIEVGAQHEIEGFSIGEYADYLDRRSSMHKLLNMLSLEVSATSLSSTVLSPRVVRQVDWIDCKFKC
jgi:F-box/leucine-rich repeat protein 10/11